MGVECLCGAPLAELPPGAKLGAIRGGFKRTAVDVVGLETRHRQAELTPMDTHGHRLAIYGSGGWVFESPRARCTKPLISPLRHVPKVPYLANAVVVKEILGSHSPSE